MLLLYCLWKQKSTLRRRLPGMPSARVAVDVGPATRARHLFVLEPGAVGRHQHRRMSMKQTRIIAPCFLLVMAWFLLGFEVSFAQDSNQEEKTGDWKTRLADRALIYDDFNDPASLSNWTNFATVEGWPDRIKRVEIDQTKGSLMLEPRVGAWFWGGHGAYIYREIEGDFIALARINIHGVAAEQPSVMWSRGGLLLREPPDLSIDKVDRDEIFLHIMRVEEPRQSGIYTSLNELQTEEAATSQSSIVQTHDKYYYRWKFDKQPPQPTRSTWVELGIVRIGNALFTISKADDQPWTVRRQNYRPLFSDKVQIGLASASVALTEDKQWIFQSISTNEYNTVIQPTAYGPDVVMEVDYFSVFRPELTAAERASLTRKDIDEDY
jgi:hypothetical protein